MRRRVEFQFREYSDPLLGDSDSYRARRAELDRLLTVFGRKPVLEALRDATVDVVRLHVADSNRDAGILREIHALAVERQVEIRHHSREALSRISRNRRQDQGVAADLAVPGSGAHDEFIATHSAQPFEVLALDGVTNPQNVGLCIRAVCASPCAALLLPRRGCASIDGLVIKASAGTVFRAPLLRCETLDEALTAFRASGARIVGVAAGADAVPLAELPAAAQTLFVLGNETDGLSPQTLAMCDVLTSVPMARGVESLNVAMAATLVALRTVV